MPVSEVTPIAEARALLEDDLLGPQEIASVFDLDAATLPGASDRILSEVPFGRAGLRAARARDEFLILRVPHDGHEALTTMRLCQRFPDLVQSRLMRGVGYLLKDEWTIDAEPFAASATCRLEWRLVHKTPVPSTCNLSYEQQSEALAAYAASAGLEGTLRRRSAIEILYDSLLYQRARGVRLLEQTWDWSDTATEDNGFITVGGFTLDGLHVIGYSRAVRFGGLGICPQH